MITTITQGTPIDEILITEKILEREKNRKCLLKVIGTLRFLAMENIAIRNTKTEDSKLYKMLELRGEDDPDLLQWLLKRRGNYLSPENQNEILELMGKEILRQVLEPIKKAKFFGLMCDEASDVSNFEQAVIVIRYVNDNYNALEEFRSPTA